MIYFECEKIEHAAIWGSFLVTFDAYRHHKGHPYKAWSLNFSFRPYVWMFTICWKNREAYERLMK